MLYEVLNQDGVLELRLTVTSNFNEVIILHSAGLFEHLDNRLLNLLVRIVHMDEDLLDCV